MAAYALRKQFLQIAEKWPADPLRPELSFANFLSNRIERDFSAINHQTPIDLENQRRQLDALYSLLEDRYKTKYPVTTKLLCPASNPDYYDKLIKELELAPKRSWWESFVNSWKGYIRLS